MFGICVEFSVCEPCDSRNVRMQQKKKTTFGSWVWRARMLDWPDAELPLGSKNLRGNRQYHGFPEALLWQHFFSAVTFFVTSIFI